MGRRPEISLLFLGLIAKRVVVEVLLLAPCLFFTALSDDPRFAVDGSADAAQRARVDVQQ